MAWNEKFVGTSTRLALNYDTDRRRVARIPSDLVRTREIGKASSMDYSPSSYDLRIYGASGRSRFNCRWPFNANFTCTKRDGDDNDDNNDRQNAGKWCRARIILEWKWARRGAEGKRERVPPRRRQPFTCKSSTSFLHTPPCPSSSSLPLDFLSRPQFVDFHPPIFFFSFYLFSSPFSRRLYVLAVRGDKFEGMGSKQRNVRKDDFNTLFRERETAQGGFY